jgi:hypothetical protein
VDNWFNNLLKTALPPCLGGALARGRDEGRTGDDKDD